MLQERSDNLVIFLVSAEITGNKERHSSFVTNQFPNLNSRSNACCHKTLLYFLQHTDFSELFQVSSFHSHLVPVLHKEDCTVNNLL